MNKLYIDWSRYLSLIDQLYNKIDWKREKFDVIIGINRGGVIPATILSHKSGIPSITLNKSGMIYERGKFLVVDDVSHTGNTLAHITYLSQGASLEYHPLQYANKDFKIATLHYRESSKVQPDYFVEIVKNWIVYPYEQK
jgi:uncharacterized protein